MAIPKHHEFRIPILKLLKDGSEISTQDFVEPMAEEFGITDEERNTVYDKGKHNKFSNRVFWALSYLNMSGLVDKPKRGIYKISEKGIELLKTPDKINSYVKDEVKKRREQTNDSTETANEQSDSNEDLTPEEILFSSYDKIRQSIYVEILDVIQAKSPREFENLVVMLLQKMGYGGELTNSGLVTQYSNDGGIDGIIKEDVLGLGRIHIQAKRYQAGQTISREDIQKFVGALGLKRHLVAWGIKEESITEFDWWDSINFHEIRLTFTPTRHFSGRGLSSLAKCLWGGWAFNTSEVNVWFSGDGGYGKHFKEIGKKLGPFDLAFMECGQYNKDWPDIHMFPNQSVYAALDAGVKKAIPVHWAGFNLSYAHSWYEPAADFRRYAIENELPLHLPQLGEIFSIQDTNDHEWWGDHK